MFNLAIPLFSLFTGTGLLLMGSGLLNTLLALSGSASGFSSTQIGLMTSGYFFGFMLGTFLVPRLLRRVGYARTFSFAGAMLACSVLLHAFWTQPVFWTLLRIATGIALVVLYSLIESWLNDQAKPESRGSLMSFYMIVSLLALAIAQQLIQLDSPLEATLFLLSAFFVCLSLMPIAMTRLTQPVVADHVSLNIGAMFRSAPVAGLTAIFAGLGMGAFWGILPAWAQSAGLDNRQIALFMSTAIIGGASLQIPLGRFSDRFDRRRVILIVAAATCGSSILLALVSILTPGVMSLLLALIFLYGGFAFTLYPLAVAHLIDNIHPDNILSACSSVLILFGIGAALGPVVSGSLMDRLGSPTLPAYFALVHLALAVLVLQQLARHPRLLRDEEQEAHFVPLTQTTPAAMELHPDQSEQPVLDPDTWVDEPRIQYEEVDESNEAPDDEGGKN